jgi:hypothetical protein
MSSPWEVKGVPWKTEAAYWVWVRGVLRKGWSRHPVKLEYVKSLRKKIPNPNPDGRVKTVWGATCVSCKEDHPLGLSRRVRDRIKRRHGVVVEGIEVDHKNAASSLKSVGDLAGFTTRLFYVTFDDLQLLCTRCHGIKTHCDRYGFTEEEAIIDKKGIAFGKLPVGEQKTILLNYSVLQADMSNAKKRRECYTKLLKGDL